MPGARLAFRLLGPSRHFAAPQQQRRFRSKADPGIVHRTVDEAVVHRTVERWPRLALNSSREQL
jgi:hypothetical protein